MTTVTMGSLSALLYLLSGCGLALRLKNANNNNRLTWLKYSVLILGWCATILHTLILLNTILVVNRLNINFFNMLSLTGCLLGIVFLLGVTRYAIEHIGAIVLPISAVTLVISLLFPSKGTIAAQGVLTIHILIATLAYVFLVLAAVQAILLAIQDHRLHHHKPGGFLRILPPLTKMELLLFQMISTGFILLSITLFSGFFFWRDLFNQHLVHETLLSLIAWVIFAMLLWGRWRFGWRGRTAMRWTISGFLLLLTSFLGSKLLLDVIN